MIRPKGQCSDACFFPSQSGKADAAGAVRFEVDGMVHGKLYAKIDAEMLGALAATIAKERGWGVWRMLRMAWAIGREMLRFARRAENVGKGEA